MRYYRMEERVLLTAPARLWPGGEHDDIIDGLEEATDQDLVDAGGRAGKGREQTNDPRGHGDPSVTIRCGTCGERFGIATTSVRRAFDEALRSYSAHGCLERKESSARKR